MEIPVALLYVAGALMLGIGAAGAAVGIGILGGLYPAYSSPSARGPFGRPVKAAWRDFYLGSFFFSLNEGEGDLKNEAIH